jgi:TonB dependent receptor/TonB-dependent Receptor Plug Domain
MRFFPRSGQYIYFVLLPVLFCNLCSSPGIAQDVKPDQQDAKPDRQTAETGSSGQQQENLASAFSRQTNVTQTQEFDPVESTIEVRGDDLANRISPVREGVRGDIQSSAGTFGDFSRYLLLMPGVAANSDSFNDLLVRGGHPSENLYVVDGLEIPNINHFAVGGTTSGFTPMINTSTISKVDLQPGAYDARYSSRLSSLVEIQTRDQDESTHEGEVNLGIAGVGAFWEIPFSTHGNALFAMDRSLLNLVTGDAGLDGVPIYTNGMTRIEWSPSKSDSVSFLSLTGADSIVVRPCAGDSQETLGIDTQYGGLQSTDGLIWQHTHGPNTVSQTTVSISTQKRDIGQQTQFVSGAYVLPVDGKGCVPSATTPIYSEATFDKTTTFGYNLQHNLGHWMLSVGASGRLVELNYSVNQPIGTQSPFNPDPTWSDSDNFNQSPASWQTGSYVEVTGSAGRRWTATAGLRVETFALTSAHAWEPHAGIAFRLSSRQELRASYRRSAQLPPYIDLLSYPQNRDLPPTQAQQFSAGADIWRTDRLTMSLDAYRKNYSYEPESTEYPSLMLANMIYTPGDQFAWLPLQTGGTGKSSGLELFAQGRLTRHISEIASVTYSRTLFRAADGILRPGNYDFPLIGNAMLNFQLPRAYTLSVRDSYATGRPYTPFNIPLSLAQNRGIYDLSQVNGVRGPAYNRADISVDRNYFNRFGLVNVYVGLQNIFDRKNFLGYVWMPRCVQSPVCNAQFDGIPMQQIYQMPAFPVAGMRMDF